jgi:hypothetical protein
MYQDLTVSKCLASWVDEYGTGSSSGSDRPRIQLWSATITLKAFANFSPGLRFGNPGKNGSEYF